jgi:hypothetical protein
MEESLVTLVEPSDLLLMRAVPIIGTKLDSAIEHTQLQGQTTRAELSHRLQAMETRQESSIATHFQSLQIVFMY